MENNTCLICGSVCQKSKLKGLVQCISCDFITTNLNISDDELKQLYSVDYFHGKEYGDYLADKEIIQKNFKSRLKTILKFVNNSSDKTLFEIGCAYGFFLDVAQKHFHTVSGIDISEDAVKRAKEIFKLDVHSEDFLNYELDQKYDVFCMWDTIEHLRYPELFVEKISRNINKDGILAITTGDIGSLNAKLRGDKWRQIHPPTHLQYFSVSTLSKLLEKFGFEIVYTGHPGNLLSLNTIFYIIMVLKNNKPQIYELIKKSGLLNINLYLNLFDFMYVIGKKK